MLCLRNRWCQHTHRRITLTPWHVHRQRFLHQGEDGLPFTSQQLWRPTHTHTHTHTHTQTHIHTHVLTDKKPPSKVHKLPCWLTVPIKAQYTWPKGGILHLSKRLSNNSHFHHLRNDSKNEGLDEFALKKVVHAKMKTLPFDVDKRNTYLQEPGLNVTKEWQENCE